MHKWWFAGEDKQQEVFNASLKGLKTMLCSDHPYVILTVLWIERVCVVYSHFNATTVHQCLYGNISEGLDVSRLVRVIPLLLQWKLNQTESRLWSVSCMSWLSHSAAQRALREKKSPIETGKYEFEMMLLHNLQKSLGFLMNPNKNMDTEPNLTFITKHWSFFNRVELHICIILWRNLSNFKSNLCWQTSAFF